MFVVLLRSIWSPFSPLAAYAGLGRPFELRVAETIAHMAFAGTVVATGDGLAAGGPAGGNDRQGGYELRK